MRVLLFNTDNSWLRPHCIKVIIVHYSQIFAEEAWWLSGRASDA